MSATQFHTISVLVNNQPGVLVRIANLFSRRAFNIESLVVSPAFDGRFSRMTITAAGSPATLEQIIKQLNKLVDVITASEHEAGSSLEKELALVKVKVSEKKRSDVLQLIQHFKAQTVDVSEESLIIQITGNSDKLDACIELLEPYGILELVRTGKVLMTRGVSTT